MPGPGPRPLGRGADGLRSPAAESRAAWWWAPPTRTAATRPTDPQKPENLAATIYHALGIPATAAWKDELDRPHHVYHGEPIPGLI